jgi:hypothetical protein
MTLSFQDLQAAEAESALLNSNEYGQTLTHTHPETGAATIVGILDTDALDVGQAAPTTAAGTKIRNRGLLEILASVAVVEERPTGYPSKFTIDGDIWILKRIVGSDSGTQTLEVYRVDQKATKRQ